MLKQTTERGESGRKDGREGGDGMQPKKKVGFKARVLFFWDGLITSQATLFPFLSHTDFIEAVADAENDDY